MNNSSLFPKISFSYLRKTVGVIVIISLSFSAGYFFGFRGFKASLTKFPLVHISRETPASKQNLDFSLFWKVWDTLDAKYYDKTKLIPAQMVYGAIRGMVAGVGDPYTTFLPPDENKVVQEDLSGNFEGVGVQIGFVGSQLAVIAPLPGSPAETAGVKAGDFIIGIKDELKNIDRGTVGITLPEAVEIIRGPSGSSVNLTILRNGGDRPLSLDIVRQSINVPSVSLKYVGPDEAIADIRVLKFSAETASEWDSAIIDILQKPQLAGVIVDLRNNPGGYLQGAVDLASEFLETGKTAVIEEGGNGEKQEYKVERLGRLRNQKVVVLVNRGSASASEILAGALRDNKGIKLIGETTFGKGTIQEPEQINGGAGLHITIAKWLTPKGTWVNEKGLKPDNEIADNSETPEDEQLDEAINQISRL